jgi:hypothetical protein
VAFLWRLFFVFTLFCIPLGATAQENGSTAQQPTAEAQQPAAQPQQPDANTAKTGVGIICNTPQQIERYLKLHITGAEPSDALATVNAEAQNPTACGITATAFVETKEISKVSISDGFLRLVQITVLATRNTLGWHRVPPTVQYTALFVKAQEV